MSTLRTVSVARSRRAREATPDTIRVPRTQLDCPPRITQSPLGVLLSGAIGWTAARIMAGLMQLDEQLSR